MSPNPLKNLRALAAVRRFTSREQRREFVENHGPRRVRRLVAEEGMFPRRTLSPSGQAFAFDLDQQDAALRGLTKAGGKRMDQRHAKLTQEDGVNLHGYLLDSD